MRQAVHGLDPWLQAGHAGSSHPEAKKGRDSAFRQPAKMRVSNSGAWAEMEKVVRIMDVRETSDDAAHWRTRSMQERLAAAEALRQQYLSLVTHAQQRLQRVCRVTERGRG